MSNSLSISQNNLTIETSETLVNVLMVSESTVAGGAVTSVNGQDGVVVLDTDDISEGTNKFTTAANLTKLSGIATGAEVNPDVISQIEAEAGTATTERIFTAERVKQAIDALASGSVEFLNTEFRIVDSVTGFKHIADTTSLTADRTVTYPDFDFIFSDWFGSSKSINLTTLNFANGIHTQLQMVHSNSGIVDWKISGVTFYQINTSTGFQINSSTKIGWCSGFANGVMDTTIERKAAGVVEFNGTIDLSNAGTYANDAAAGADGVASGSLWIDSSDNSIKIKT